MSPKSWRADAAEAFAAYRQELAEAGIAPLETSDDQENHLQDLAVEVWKAERAESA